MNWSGATEPNILVVGYGNSLRGDDGAGWRAAEMLDELLPAEKAHVLIRHQLTPELAEAVANAERVILIDASCILQPGEIEVSQVEPRTETLLSLLHEVNAAQLVGAARSLFGRAAPTTLFSIGGECFEMGETLTPKVKQAVDEVVRKVVATIDEFLAASNSGSDEVARA